jgi:endonuclease YncB( thermonuclease family)
MNVNCGPAPGIILPVVTRRLFLLAAVAAAALYAEDFVGKVVAISDGDTIRVMHNGASERIRPFGTRAKQFTGDLAFGQVVTVKVRDIDRYKRTVAEIILPDGRNLNQEIVRAGLAWWYERYARRETVLQDLEQEARDAKRGLWSEPNPVAPWDWRKNAAAARKLQGTRRAAGSFCVRPAPWTKSGEKPSPGSKRGCATSRRLQHPEILLVPRHLRSVVDGSFRVLSRTVTVFVTIQRERWA